jgi:hypothetical protein
MNDTMTAILLTFGFTTEEASDLGFGKPSRRKVALCRHRVGSAHYVGGACTAPVVREYASMADGTWTYVGTLCARCATDAASVSEPEFARFVAVS